VAGKPAKRSRCARLLLLAPLLAVLRPPAALAIPVFARVYDKPCGACHTVYPQLNPEGELFRARGLHGYPPAVEPIRLGPRLDLPGTLPIAVSLAVGEDVSKIDLPGRPDPVNTHFNMPFLAVLAGGEIGPHLAFLADYAPLFTNPVSGEIVENTRLGMGFLQAHAARWGWLANLKGGLFELPLGTSPRVHRLTTQGYLVYGLTAFDLLGRAPPVTGARTDSLVLGATQLGFELSGLHPGSDVGVAIGSVAGSNNREDNNSTKDLFARLSRGFGFHRAGLFFYYSPDTLGRTARSELLRVGPDLTLYWRRLRLVGQWLSNWDSNPTGRGEALWWQGGFAEGNYRFTPGLVAILRGDVALAPSFDDRARGGTAHQRPRRWALTGGGQWLVQDNVKLIVEGTYGEAVERISDFRVRTWLVSVRLATAFWPLTPPGLAALRGGEASP
jgi:hypothetical protein